MNKNKIRLVAFLAGFISLEIEILGTRLLSPIFGQTIYVWTSLIGITLTFLALGYWYGGKLADKGKITINFLGTIILLLGIYICLLPRISRFILSQSSDLGIVLGPLLTSFVILSFPLFFLGFVVPASIKLITQSLKEVGSRAGEIYAIATLGSIAGTFVTGFFLILYFGVSKTCLVTGIVLILLSFILIKPKLKFFSLILIPLLAIFPVTLPSTILESFDSYYGQIRIIDKAPYVYLYAGTATQTAIKNETGENILYHSLFYSTPFVYNSSYKKVLMIGLAGGAIARELVQKHDIDLDVVEIEPKMLSIAKKYFYWKNEGKVYFDDGRHFLKSAGKHNKYDVIIIDIGIIHCCWNLYTLEAFQEYSKHLDSNGILLVNVVGATKGEYSKAVQSEYKTLKQVFKDVLVLRKPNIKQEGIQNIVFLASKKDINKNKLLELVRESKLYFVGGVVPLEDVIKEVDKISLDEAELTTDDYPVAERYDYIVWPELSEVSKDSLKYFLPG